VNYLPRVILKATSTAPLLKTANITYRTRLSRRVSLPLRCPNSARVASNIAHPFDSSPSHGAGG
jgi:hypothetical protein